MKHGSKTNQSGVGYGRSSRREFLKASAAVSIATLAVPSYHAYAAGSDKIRVGLVGCGRRGTGAAQDCVNASPSVELAALGDLFEDKLDSGMKVLRKLGDKLTAADDTCFVGFDAFKKVIACDIDLIILATPPGFRPEHLRATVEAGKHVFTEKPVAVDPVGVRSVLASAELAAEKKLAIVAGIQRRHQADYVATLNRIHDGAIGEIVSAQCYWIGDYGYYPAVKRRPNWSDMEAQIRNWNYFTWLSGDHIVEQHVHNIDVINWALQAHPVKAIAMGGRQQRTGPEFGHIYDHFAVEFEYPNGVRVSSMCRQSKGTAHRVAEYLVGTKGTSNPRGTISGQNPFKFEGDVRNPYEQEHADLIASIRAGEPLNEGKAVAESTMAAILGRMSAYTGQEISWKWAMNASKLDLRPAKYDMGDLPTPPVAVPGETKLI